MYTVASHALGRSLVVIAAAVLFAGCADEAPVAPHRQAAGSAQLAALPETNTGDVIARLQKATARYHRLDVAINDGFVLLHPCETRGDEGPVGIVYVHVGRLMDGKIDPDAPDALIYEPNSNGPTLVGVEFAIPKALWTEPQEPTFLGARFQSEDEFGVYALHAWVWRNNPDGLFAETNPTVSCAA